MLSAAVRALGRPILVALSVALSAIVVAIFLTRVPVASVVVVLLGAHWSALAWAAALYLATYVARAARLRVLARHAGTPALFGVVAIQTALLRIVPFRLGDLSYPLLASRLAGEDFSRSTIVLVYVRLLDLLVLLPAVPLAALTLGGVVGTRGHALLGVGGVVFATVFAAALAGFVSLPPLFRFAARVLARLPRAGPWADRLRAAADGWDGLAPGALAAAVFWSVAAWGLLYASMWSIARACGVDLGYGGIVATGTLSLVASMVPLSVGSIGFLESGFALGLVLLGAPEERAVASGLLLQWGTLALSLAAGLVSWLVLSARHESR